MTPKALPQVPVSAVTKEDLTAKVDTSGTVESLRTKTYFSPVNAAIAQYPLKVGEVVKRGDSLVAFDVSTLEQDNQKAQLNVSATVNGSKDSMAKAAQTQQKANEAAGKVPTLQANVDSYQEYVAISENGHCGQDKGTERLGKADIHRCQRGSDPGPGRSDQAAAGP